MHEDTDGSDADARDERIAALVEEYLDSGHVKDSDYRAAFLASHADIADELEDILAVVSVVESGRSADASEPPTQTATPDARPGHLGGFRIEGEIGRGGMGAVFLATDEELERRVALKLLPSRASLDARLVERFRREATATANLEHPHIVPVYGTGSEGQLHYIVMRYVEGPSLDRVLRRLRDTTIADDTASFVAQSLRQANNVTEPAAEGTAPELGDDTVYFKNVARIGAQAAQALAFAHEHGILHRDVKPGNLLVERSGHVWVTDFGLCATDASVDLTRSEELVGTLRYMAPEQIDGEASVASDVFGLGATLWELSVRQTLYEGLGRREILKRVSSGDVPRARSIDKAIPRDLEAILAKSMAPNPSDRYSTASALEHDLTAFLENRPVSARVPGTFDFLRLAYRRNRPLAWTALLAVAAVLAASIAYVVSIQRSRVKEQHELYRASISATVARISQRQTVAAQKALMLAPENLRGWEWDHLEARLDRGELLTASRYGTISDLESAPDSEHVLAGFGSRVKLFEDDDILMSLRTSSYIESVALDPRGELIVAGTSNGRIHVAKIGEEKFFETTRIQQGALAMEFSPDGEHLVVGQRDGRVWIHDRTGERVRMLPDGHSGSLRQVRFTADGKRLVTSGVDGSILVHSLELGTAAHLAGHEVSVEDLDVWGHLVASCDVRGEVRVYDLDSNEEVAVHRHSASVRSIAFAGDSETVVFGDEARNLYRWDHELEDPPHSFGQCHLAAWALVWSPTRQRVLSGSISGTVESWDPFVLSGYDVLQAHASDVHAICAAPVGDRILTGGRDTHVALWNVRSQRLERLYEHHTDAIGDFAWSGDGQFFAVSDQVGAVSVCRPDVQEQIAMWRPPEEEYRARRISTSLAFDRDDERLFVPHRGFALRIFSVPDLRVLREFPELKDCLCVATSATDPIVFLGFRDGHVETRDSETMKLIHTFEGHDKSVFSITPSPDDRLIATVAYDGRCFLWDWRAGELHRVLAVSDLEVSSLSPQLISATFHPDGTRLAISARGHGPSLWNVETGELAMRFDEVSRWASTAAFLADGEALLCGDSEGRLHVWTTGEVTSSRNWLASQGASEAALRHRQARHQLSRRGLAASIEFDVDHGSRDPRRIERTFRRAFALVHRNRGWAVARYLYGRSFYDKDKAWGGRVYLEPLVEAGHPDLTPEQLEISRQLLEEHREPDSGQN